MKRHSAEEIILKLRQAEADLAQGASLAQVCQRLGVSEPTFHRWRHRYSGLKADEARRLKDLEAENGRLKRLVAELALDKQMLQEVVQKKVVTAEQRRQAVRFLEEEFEVSQRRGCRVLGQPRSTQRQAPKKATQEEARLVARVLALVRKHPRYGYRRI
jgi:putative transposase